MQSSDLPLGPNKKLLLTFEAIIEYEFGENEEQILNKTIQFYYQANTQFINEIQVLSGQSVKLATDKYKVKYDGQGFVKELINNGSKFIYEVR